MIWDVFISHASEDKDEVVRPLAEELESRGLRIWFDEMTLNVGDSLRESIDKGIAQSRFGIVVLSKSFFAKDWTRLELDGLFVRESAGERVILPVWHELTAADVRNYSNMLAARVAARTSDGLATVADQIEEAIHAPEESSHASEILASQRTIDGAAAHLLVLLVRRADVDYDDVPEEDELLEELGLNPGELQEAIEELEALGLAKGHGAANAKTGYIRAVLEPDAYLKVAPKVFRDVEFRELLSRILRGFDRPHGELVVAVDVLNELGVPPVRFQLLTDYLNVHGHLEREGMNATLEPPFFTWGRLTGSGKRLARGKDPLPVLGGWSLE